MAAVLNNIPDGQKFEISTDRKLLIFINTNALICI